MIMNNHFARNLRWLREEDHLTQRSLAKKLNVSPATISMWENGNRIPDIIVIDKLCECFKVDYNTLLE